MRTGIRLIKDRTLWVKLSLSELTPKIHGLPINIRNL